MSAPGPLPPSNPWALHLITPAKAGDANLLPALAPAEAARVQQHQERLMTAWRAQDRRELLCAKQEVLQAAFAHAGAHPNAASAPSSPALRRALRDLSWRMASLLLRRGPGHTENLNRNGP